MNVHPTQTLDDLLTNLSTFTAPIRDRVAPNDPMGIGLWLPAAVAAEVRADPGPLRDQLQKLNVYAFTMNGFPFGIFHGTQVKTAVYLPDWGDPARLRYTCDLLHLLAVLLPPGVTGSISTLPVGYGKKRPDLAESHLIAAGEEALSIYEKTGCRIYLGLEPEPDCFLENTVETVTFLQRLRERAGRAAEFLGVCFDTCHLALQFEDLSTSLRTFINAGIPITKIQLSAALCYDNTDHTASQSLKIYDEPVYLHQTRVEERGKIHHFSDLSDALRADPGGNWRIHFHVPLTYQGVPPLRTTAEQLTPKFIQSCFRATANIEVETYSFNVLPPPLPDLRDSIASEITWVLSAKKQ